MINEWRCSGCGQQFIGKFFHETGSHDKYCSECWINVLTNTKADRKKRIEEHASRFVATSKYTKEYLAAMSSEAATTIINSAIGLAVMFVDAIDKREF